MRVLWANIEEVFREAAARWTLVAYFFLSSLFIFIFAIICLKNSPAHRSNFKNDEQNYNNRHS